MNPTKNTLRARSIALFDDVETENAIAIEAARLQREMVTTAMQAKPTNLWDAPATEHDTQSRPSLTQIVPTVVDRGASHLLQNAVDGWQSQTNLQRALLAAHYQRIDALARAEANGDALTTPKGAHVRTDQPSNREPYIFDEKGEPITPTKPPREAA